MSVRDEMAYQVVEQLVTNGSDHLKGLLGRHRVHQHITMDANEMLARHDAVLILSIAEWVSIQETSSSHPRDVAHDSQERGGWGLT